MFTSRKMVLPVVAALAVVGLIVWAGCSQSNTGTMPANQPPRLYVANIPTEGAQFSANPTLYWYATDGDGYIRAYRYIVKKADDINDDPLAFVEQTMAQNDYSAWTTIFVDSVATSTSGRIPMFASENPEVYTRQYFFVQAIDNHDAVSAFTDTVSGNVTALGYRLYARNNHAPETYVSFNADKTYFSLADTTASYRGVPVSWSGSDSLDYKRSQPAFQYHWKVYGPFDTPEDTNTTDPAKFVYESHDTTTGQVWVENQTEVLFDLFRNAPPSATTRKGYFVFSVVSRDDASVPDTSAATAVIEAIDPKFEKRLMLIDNTGYARNLVALRAAVMPPAKDDPYLQKYRAYFSELFSTAGYTLDYYRWWEGGASSQQAPPKDTLAQFQVIVTIKESNVTDKYAPETFLDAFSEYLDIGGRIMFVAWNSFRDVNQSNANKQVKPFRPTEFPYKYFDVSGEYEPTWEDPNAGWLEGNTNEEFKQASSLGVAGLPARLEYDTEHLKEYFVASQWWDAAAHQNFYPFKAEPCVNYYQKTVRAEPLYITNSIYKYGEFPFPYTSIDGTVCGVRLRTDTYRTAAFGFSLYCLKHDDAVALLRGMMDWFFAE